MLQSRNITIDPDKGVLDRTDATHGRGIAANSNLFTAWVYNQN